jgi:phage terminase large subunit
MRELTIKHTGVFTKNFEALSNKDVRFILNQGGSRSSKTYSIVQMLIYYALTNSKKTISVCRKTMPSLKSSVYSDIITILVELELYHTVKHNKSAYSFEFPNGTWIRCFSIDNPQKIRGRKHDVVFMNEANNFTQEDFVQLNMRTTEKVILDFNPSDEESHWIYGLKADPKTRFIHSTYRDNSYLSADQITEIEKLIAIDEEFYEIYALGRQPKKRERIFPVVHKTPFPETEDYVYGMDWGFADPTTLIKVHLNDGKLYIKEEIYETGLNSDEVIEKMQSLNINKTKHIWADSARPDLIDLVASKGYYITKSNKAIKEGLNAMRLHEIHIDPDSYNTLREFRAYSFKKRGDTVLDEPQGFFDHSIDATRYATIGEYKQSGFSTTFMVI